MHAKLVGHRPQTTITYVEIKHVDEDRSGEENSWQIHKTQYLQPLPDLSFPLYSNAIAQMY